MRNLSLLQMAWKFTFKNLQPCPFRYHSLAARLWFWVWLSNFCLVQIFKLNYDLSKYMHIRKHSTLLLSIFLPMDASQTMQHLHRNALVSGLQNASLSQQRVSTSSLAGRGPVLKPAGPLDRKISVGDFFDCGSLQQHKHTLLLAIKAPEIQCLQRIVSYYCWERLEALWGSLRTYLGRGEKKREVIEQK